MRISDGSSDVWSSDLAVAALAAAHAGGARMKKPRAPIKPLLRHALLVLVLLGTGVLIFVALGMAPIAAYAGHWGITRVLLHSAMSRAVEVRRSEERRVGQAWVSKCRSRGYPEP